jgi:phosphate-selective porin
MKNFSKLSLLVLALSMASAASAYSTKVKVTKEPDYTFASGKGLLVTTNKGTVAIEKRLGGAFDGDAYSSFKGAQPGNCFVLETESESTVEFNKSLGQSGAMTATKVKC